VGLLIKVCVFENKQEHILNVSSQKCQESEATNILISLI
jgi:hypothetical protein